MAKKRINISLDTDLHEDAKVLAFEHHKTDLSGLITQLIVADLERTGVGAAGETVGRQGKTQSRSPVDEEIERLRRGVGPKQRKNVGARRHSKSGT